MPLGGVRCLSAGGEQITQSVKGLLIKKEVKRRVTKFTKVRDEPWPLKINSIGCMG
jgi:hypothetical protein